MAMIEGSPLLAGSAEGKVLRLDAPLSLWGGLDPKTGRIIDARHPQRGESVSGRILVMPTGRGSSSSSTILAEATRLGTAPAAILLTVTDPVLVIGAIVACRLYGVRMPLVRVGAAAQLRTDEFVRVHEDGRIEPIAG